MTINEINDYLLPAMLNLGYKNSYKHALELEKLLGRDEYKKFIENRLPDRSISEEYKKQLIALAGPHGKTILKMIRINKGLE